VCLNQDYGELLRVLRAFVEIQIADRQNVDIQIVDIKGRHRKLTYPTLT
jgi:hypothetical protein